MSSKKGYIDSRFWDDNYIVNLGPIEKLMFLYFLSNDLKNLVGIYEISFKRIGDQTGIGPDTVKKIVERFERDRKIFSIDGWVFVKNYLMYVFRYVGSNPNVRKGVCREWNEIPLTIREKIKGSKGFESLSNAFKHYNLDLDLDLDLYISLKRDNNSKIRFGKVLMDQGMQLLKKNLNGSVMDGAERTNRRYLNLLLRKFVYQFPNHAPLALVERLIEKARQDRFHKANLTSFRYLFYNAGKIINLEKVGREEKKLTVFKAY